MLHSSSIASNSKRYLLQSQFPVEWKVSIETKGKKKKKSDLDIWVDIICLYNPRCWHASSLAIADILRVCTLHACLNKGADKEYLSVSSIWSSRLFESVWVYLAGHADSLWTIYHCKKTPEAGTLPVSCLFFPPPPLSPLLGIDATSKQTSSSHSNRTFLYNLCMGTLHKPSDNHLEPVR